MQAHHEASAELDPCVAAGRQVALVGARIERDRPDLAGKLTREDVPGMAEEELSRRGPSA